MSRCMHRMTITGAPGKAEPCTRTALPDSTLCEVHREQALQRVLAMRAPGLRPWPSIARGTWRRFVA